MNTSAKLLDFKTAKQQLLNQATLPNQVETLPLTQALHRVLAKAIISPINVPAFNNSAMDGYAVRFSDLAQSKILTVSPKIFAGDNCPDEWPAGSCIRIMTGAPVPDDADAVVMQEETQQTDAGIQFSDNIKPGQNIRRAGEDVQQGVEVVQAGTYLTIPLLSTLSSLGIANITVYQPIRVAIFSTGNELVSAGQPLPAGKIYDSNRFTIQLMLQTLGCQVLDLGIISDDSQAIKQALLQAAEQADLIITSGGVSVGEADFTKQVLDEIGAINFWKLAIKPGKPFAFGKIQDKLFCGLPGNPVSAAVTFYQLVQPLIQKLSGQIKPVALQAFMVRAATDFKKRPGRLDFQRGELKLNAQGELIVAALPQQGSHITQSLSKANCFVVLEKERDNVSAGEMVQVELFNQLMQ